MPLRELFWDYRTNLDAYPAFHFAAYDWNCAQYITPRFTEEGCGKASRHWWRSWRRCGRRMRSSALRACA